MPQKPHSATPHFHIPLIPGRPAVVRPPLNLAQSSPPAKHAAHVYLSRQYDEQQDATRTQRSLTSNFGHREHVPLQQYGFVGQVLAVGGRHGVQQAGMRLGTVLEARTIAA